MGSGTFSQKYSNGHKDLTSIGCDGVMVWRAGRLKENTHHRVNAPGVPHPDPKYEGWFYRDWDRPAAWEYFRFKPNGDMEVHHFCTDSSVCSKTSPLNSSNFCCSSVSPGGTVCSQDSLGSKGTDTLGWKGTFQQKYSNGHVDSTSINCNGVMVWRAGKLTEVTHRRVNGPGVPHPDAKYEGWFYRDWDRSAAWEYFRFKPNGDMEVHHFCTDHAACSKTSPLGSSNFCCSSISPGGTVCSQTLTRKSFLKTLSKTADLSPL